MQEDTAVLKTKEETPLKMQEEAPLKMQIVVVEIYYKIKEEILSNSSKTIMNRPHKVKASLILSMTMKVL